MRGNCDIVHAIHKGIIYPAFKIDEICLSALTGMSITVHIYGILQSAIDPKGFVTDPFCGCRATDSPIIMRLGD